MASSQNESEDHNEYDVEAIRASRSCKHKGSKGAHDYLIKWKGYDSDDNTWECYASIDAPKLLEEFWKKQHKVDSGHRTRKNRPQATRPTDVPQEPPVKRKKKETKQPRVVIASPYSSDDDTITDTDNPEILTASLQPNYPSTPTTSLSLSPTGPNQRPSSWVWTLPAATAPPAPTVPPVSAVPPAPTVSSASAVPPASTALTAPTSTATPTPTPTAPVLVLAAAATSSENLQPYYNTTVNALNNDYSSRGEYGWYPSPTPTADPKFNELPPETLAFVNGTILTSSTHNRQSVFATDRLSFRLNEKDGTPIIVFNNLDLQVQAHFRDDWNWEEQVSHIEKLLVKKHEGASTFYFVVRWKDGLLSAHDSATIRSRCPLKALDFHEKQIADEY